MEDVRVAISKNADRCDLAKDNEVSVETSYCKLG